jgi:uncharacterized protein
MISFRDAVTAPHVSFFLPAEPLVPMIPGTFLIAEWRHLAMLNYEVDPAILQRFVPTGTELDSFDGRAYVSVVGFLFLDTKVLGLPVPFHRDFEEVNLRMYVRRKGQRGWQRGVTFIKEIVPRTAIAAAARLLYNEKYVAMPMRHSVETEGSVLKQDAEVEYGWLHSKRWNVLRVRTTGEARQAAPGSLEEFITEHYWGYATQRDGGTVEYRVEHPKWNIWQTQDAAMRCNVASIYGKEFVEPLKGKPSNAFVADGSSIIVRKGIRI